MTTQGQCRSLVGYLFILILAVFVAGCGGDSGGDTPAVTTAEVVTFTLNPGVMIPVRVGEVAVLDGKFSHSVPHENSENPLTYAWSFAHKPDGSVAELQNDTSVSPTFTPDKKGTYTVQLVITARGVSSPRAISYVEATVAPERLTGTFSHEGLNSNCGNCHNGVISKIGKSGDHVATSNVCQACHTTFGFELIRFVDHQEIPGSVCEECHNGVIAVGKSAGHTPTDAACSECHDTISFFTLVDGKFDHSTITRVCSSCHNGNLAIGKDSAATHPATDSECGYCHTTLSFTGAFVDHSGPDVVGKLCGSCHNGTNAVGQTVGHPDMIFNNNTVDCGECHSVQTFSLGGVYNHRIDATILSCSTCHTGLANNSIGAPGKVDFAGHTLTEADCGMCHNTETFVGGFVDHSGPLVVGFRCDSCHNGTDAVGKPVPDPVTGPAIHVVTTEDCSLCHTPGTFATGVFDHTAVKDDLNVRCDSCHNDSITVGKIGNHIKTSEDCRVCHLNTDTFVGGVFSHVGITNGCVACHDGKIATGQKVNHIPTNSLSTEKDCFACHTTDAFNPSTFSHAGTAGICQTCHDGKFATGKIAKHIPAENVCSTCHSDTTTGGFATAAGFGVIHTATTIGCEGCHNGKFTKNPGTASEAIFGKNLGHLPTTQDCNICHSNTAPDFKSNTFKHVGITGDCVSCHDGSYVGFGATAKTNTTVHNNSSSDCAACHSTSDYLSTGKPNFLNAFVDHTSSIVTAAVSCASCHTGKANGGAIGKDDMLPVGTHITTSQDCDVCHAVGGSFSPAIFDHNAVSSNLNIRCDSCHNGTDATGTVDKKPVGSHVDIGKIGVGKDCRVCHNTTAFAGAKFNHQGITNNCVSCHDGVTAIGKNQNHVPTSQDCYVCHQTTGFIPGTFDHVKNQIVGNCKSCHDGNFATGKTTNHVATNADCGDCHHNFTTFKGATFDHSTVSINTRCDSCHGVTATGKNTGHLETSLDCRNCHTTATFVGGTWDHVGITGNCGAQCHDGVKATGKPNGHFVTTEECNACHTTTKWVPTKNYDHCPGTTAATCSTSTYPGNHNSRVSCNSCHNNNATITLRSPTYKGFCASCHEGDFRRQGDHIGGSNGTVAQNKNCGASGCHRVSAGSF